MKAIWFTEHGGIDVLRFGEFAEPVLEPGQVRVRVRACSLNYHDVFTRRGMPGIKVPLPMIPGCDCAGEVLELGPGVSGWKRGDRVLVDPVERLAKGRFRFIGDNALGAYAETVVVGAGQLLPLPDAVTFEAASCLPVAYGTSHRMLRTRGELRAGETILVLGASGGVGTSCVLLAKRLGAYVIAAAGSEAKCRRLRRARRRRDHRLQRGRLRALLPGPHRRLARRRRLRRRRQLHRRRHLGAVAALRQGRRQTPHLRRYRRVRSTHRHPLHLERRARRARIERVAPRGSGGVAGDGGERRSRSGDRSRGAARGGDRGASRDGGARVLRQDRDRSGPRSA